MPVEHTPDGCYIIVRERLLRSNNPDLDEATRQQLVETSNAGRRRVRVA